LSVWLRQSLANEKEKKQKGFGYADTDFGQLQLKFAV
jgi:hypothetical protein